MASARALRAGKAVIELSLLTTGVEKQLKHIENRMKNFGKAMTSIGSAGLKVTAGLAGLAAFPVKMAADLEKTRAEFTALIGDAGKASQLLSDIEGFALVTPLGSADLSAAARTMMSFGVALEDIMPTLRRIGEVSGGDSERMGRLALAFGQVTAKGKLMAQEVNQMVESGFNPLQEISRTTGESMGDLAKRMEAGGISAAEVSKAFATATSQGGRFNGLLAKMADTTTGRFNELRESIVMAVRPIGDALLPLMNDYMQRVKEIVPQVAAWIKNNRDTIQTVGEMTVKLGAASIALIAVGTAVQKLTTILSGARIAFAAIAAHPVIAGLALLAVGLDRATLALGRYLEKLTGVDKVNASLEAELSGAKSALAEMEAAQSDLNSIVEESKTPKHFSVPFVNQPSLPSPKLQLPKTWKRWIDDAGDAFKDKMEAVKIRPLILDNPARWMEMKAKEVRDAVAAAGEWMGGDAPMEQLFSQQATFDARFSRQMYGRTGDDPNTKLLREQLAELKGIRRQEGGLNVV